MDKNKKKEYRLPKKFAEEWIDALRSGNYKQGRGKLYNKKEERFCCLGVACMLNKDNDKDDLIEEMYLFDDRNFTKHIPNELFGSEIDSLSRILSEFNDGSNNKRYSFDEIADWIEENVELY